MAHLSKFTMSGAGQLLQHNEREREYEEAYGNKEINHELTMKNYDFIDDDRRAIDRLRDRLEEVKVLKRADVNVLCGWVVHLPENIPEERSREFFENTFNFLQDKYGSENAVSAVVHMDETRDHMHYTFVPVVEDKRTGTPKVSAKELITRRHLSEFHPELKAYLEKEMNCEVSILTGATAGGNRAVKELKAESEAIKLEPKLEPIPHRQSKLKKNEVIVNKTDFEALQEKAKFFDFATLRMRKYDDEIAEVKRKAEILRKSQRTKYERKIEGTTRRYELRLDRAAETLENQEEVIDDLKKEVYDLTEALEASKEELRVAKEVILEAGLISQFQLAMKADKEKKMTDDKEKKISKEIRDDFELSF